MTHTATSALPDVDVHLGNLVLAGALIAAPTDAISPELAPARPPRHLSDEFDEEEEGMLDADDDAGVTN
jgi:hypothetical protein